MRKKILLFSLFVVSIANVFANDSLNVFPKHSVQLQTLMLPRGIVAFNYERDFNNFGLQVGIGVPFTTDLVYKVLSDPNYDFFSPNTASAPLYSILSTGKFQGGFYSNVSFKFFNTNPSGLFYQFLHTTYISSIADIMFFFFDDGSAKHYGELNFRYTNYSYLLQGSNLSAAVNNLSVTAVTGRTKSNQVGNVKLVRDLYYGIGVGFSDFTTYTGSGATMVSGISRAIVPEFRIGYSIGIGW